MRQRFPLDAINLNRSSREPLHRQLYAALRKMINDQLLPAGSELPSTRSLALDLGTARNTVIAAYDQLATEGYLHNRPGARLVVVALASAAKAQVISHRSPAGRPLSRRGELILLQPVHHGRPGEIAFHPGMPDAKHFPFGIWSRMLARRSASAGGTLFGTYDVNGLPALREAISGYLRTARGVHCSPDNIVVTTGAQAAFDLLARLLLDPGDHVWMEEPGYYGAQSAFIAAGAQLLAMPVGLDGWTLQRPRPAPRLIYVTPACQHPFGLTMRMDQRIRLLELAEEADAWIIEDDFDGEYRFQGDPVPALQNADRTERVIYVGTFAKILFPALRLGFMVLPTALQERIPHALGTTGQFAPLLLQAALADFITEGYMNRHLKRMRRIYAARRQLFQALCEQHLVDDLTLLSGNAGIQVVGFLRDMLDDQGIASQASHFGLNLSALSKHYRHGSPRQGLVLGYAACDEPLMQRGIFKLRNAIRAYQRRPGPPGPRIVIPCRD